MLEKNPNPDCQILISKLVLFILEGYVIFTNNDLPFNYYLSLRTVKINIIINCINISIVLNYLTVSYFNTTKIVLWCYLNWRNPLVIKWNKISILRNKLVYRLQQPRFSCIQYVFWMRPDYISWTDCSKQATFV